MNEFPPVPRKLMPGGTTGGAAQTGSSVPNYPSNPEVRPGGATPGTPGTPGTPPAVSMGINRQALIKNYANLVARTWADDSYLQSVLSNPADALARAGLPTTPGAVIRVVQCKLTGMGKMDEQVDLWINGVRTGLYDLYLPMKPDGVEVSGGSGATGGDSCCCTPCCCCT